MQASAFTEGVSMRLDELRQRKALTQEELAEQVGVARSAIARWEAGVSRPLPRHRRKMAEIFGVDVATIEYGDGKPTKAAS
jgi:transcriptional regulator with XRE-family HTH domain